MGIYNLGVEEVIEDFDVFLQRTSMGRGDISADVIANCWNKLAVKYEWSDRLKAYYKDEEEDG